MTNCNIAGSGELDCGNAQVQTDDNTRSSLSPKQRSAYTTAVECLQSKPNLISNIRVPGARTRFDDVVAAHIFQAPYIHFSVSSIIFPRPLPFQLLNMVTPNPGHLPSLASLLHLPLRQAPPHRMRLHRPSTLLGLDPHLRRSTRLQNLLRYR